MNRIAKRLRRMADKESYKKEAEEFLKQSMDFNNNFQLANSVAEHNPDCVYSGDVIASISYFSVTDNRAENYDEFMKEINNNILGIPCTSSKSPSGPTLFGDSEIEYDMPFNANLTKGIDINKLAEKYDISKDIFEDSYFETEDAIIAISGTISGPSRTSKETFIEEYFSGSSYTNNETFIEEYFSDEEF